MKTKKEIEDRIKALQKHRKTVSAKLSKGRASCKIWELKWVIE